MKRNRQGATLVELVVTMAATVILLTAAVVGIVQYVHFVEFRKQNEYAHALFNAAQMQLTRDSQLGQLDKLTEATQDEKYSVPISALCYDSGKVTDGEIWGDSNKVYQGRLCSIIVTPADYKEYAAGTLKDGTKKELYDLLSTHIYDKSILKASVCLEFDPAEGLVYSVLYSDKASGFTYGTDSSEAVSIADRTTGVRKERMVGYYGVAQLSKSTSTEAENPTLGSVMLNNEETLNLSFRLSKVQEATMVLNYEVVVCDAATRTPLFSITFNNETLNQHPSFDSANYSLVTQNSETETHTIVGKVIRYASDGTTETGYYQFPAWVQDDGTVRLVLDAVDLGASVWSYRFESLANTFSLHRFGISAESICCTVQGSGGGYKTTAKKESNSENPYFGSYSPATGSDVRSYTIFNARHLYNMRFVECSSSSPKTNYVLTADVSWKNLISAGYVYVSQKDLVKNGHTWLSTWQPRIYCSQFTNSDLLLSPEASAFDTAFVSMDTLREGCSLQSAGSPRTISGISFLNRRNVYENVGKDLGPEPTGLFLYNDGTIRNIRFDSVTSIGSDSDILNLFGSESVGTACGVNRGTVADIEVLNTDGSSVVKGSDYVGGVVGKQDFGSREYTGLVNHAKVQGENRVGGIIGSLNAYLGEKITVSSCKNYGQVSGSGSYIGGITGYAGTDLFSQLDISGCISCPQYRDDEIFSGTELKPGLLIGRYVGGIVGYSNGASISKCSTKCENGANGYVFGEKFVGGIVGYNEGSLEGNGSVNQVHVVGDSYVGGIVGVNAAVFIVYPILDWRSDYTVSGWTNEGTVVAMTAYSGGITGANTGKILNCTSNVNYDEKAQRLTHLSSAKCDCAGGLVGYNNGSVEAGDPESVVSAVSGNNYVGGIIGYNDTEGTVSLPENVNVQVNSSGNCVGGIIGLDSGSLGTESGTVVVNGSGITGNRFVGGVIGYYQGSEETLSGFVNKAPVAAANGASGGIVGSVPSGWANHHITISKCRNEAEVKATRSGDAGGIISYISNSTIVDHCEDYAAVSALNGSGGGITGVNGGTISSCVVSKTEQNSGTSSLLSQFRSSLSQAFTDNNQGPVRFLGNLNVGAVAGVNQNNIQNCSIEDVTVSNNSTSGAGNIGGIAGSNTGAIELNGSPVSRVTLSACSDGCSVGGIAGENSGTVSGVTGGSVIGEKGKRSLSVSFDNESVVYGNLGGAVGRNNGSVTNCNVYAEVTGNKGSSAAPENGYGGVAGVNSGTIADSGFDGKVTSDGTADAVSPTGGICGQNLAGASVLRCSVGRTDRTDILCGTTNAAYAYLGGMVGWNKGSVLGCDNNSTSGAEKVRVIGYAGRVGGIVGFNDDSGTVSALEAPGTEPVRTSTGSNWVVNAQYYSGDCGAGGIMGYSSSGNDIRYVDNYAAVWNSSGLNLKIAVGGIVGHLENKGKHNFRISHCRNYGSIWCSALSGGIVGRWENFGGTLEYDENYGSIGARPTLAQLNTGSISGFTDLPGLPNRSSGIVSSLSGQTQDSISIQHCSNYGHITHNGQGSGIAIVDDQAENMKVTISDCVNTGVFTGNLSSGIYYCNANSCDGRIYRCRNYGNSSGTTHSGISSGNVSAIYGCFSYSNAVNPICSQPPGDADGNYYVYRGSEKIDPLNCGMLLSPENCTYSGNTSVTDQKENPFSASFDGNGNTFCALNNNNQAVSNANPVTLTYTLAVPSKMSGFAVKWSNGGSQLQCRQYVYKLFYVTADGETREVTSRDSFGGRNTYNAGAKMYAENAYTSNADQNIYYHEFGSSENISKIILRVYQVNCVSASSAAGKAGNAEIWNRINTDWSLSNSADVCLYNVYGTKSGVTAQSFSADPASFLLNHPGCSWNGKTGLPLTVSKNGTTYSLNDAVYGICSINGITRDPSVKGSGTDQNGSLQSNLSFTNDFSDYEDFTGRDLSTLQSYRYQLIGEIEPKVLNYCRKTGGEPLVSGVQVTEEGSVYRVGWNTDATAATYEVTYSVGFFAPKEMTVYETNTPYLLLDREKSWGTRPLTVYVRGVYWVAGPDGTYSKKYTDWVSSDS